LDGCVMRSDPARVHLVVAVFGLIRPGRLHCTVAACAAVRGFPE
jgi:hypothetical protein